MPAADFYFGQGNQPNFQQPISKHRFLRQEHALYVHTPIHVATSGLGRRPARRGVLGLIRSPAPVARRRSRVLPRPRPPPVTPCSLSRKDPYPVQRMARRTKNARPCSWPSSVLAFKRFRMPSQWHLGRAEAEHRRAQAPRHDGSRPAPPCACGQIGAGHVRVQEGMHERGTPIKGCPSRAWLWFV